MLCSNDGILYAFSEASVLSMTLKIENLNVVYVAWKLKHNSLPPSPFSPFHVQYPLEIVFFVLLQLSQLMLNTREAQPVGTMVGFFSQGN